MPIQAITPRVTPQRINSAKATRTISPINMPVENSTPKLQKQEFNWLPDIFKSSLTKEMDEVKAIKNHHGFQRFDKEDQKEIKKYLKKGELSVDIVKTFAQTNLTIKGMSEVHEFTKWSKDPKKEQENMLKAVIEFEKPELKMPQEYKEYRTSLERGKNSTYELRNHDGSHQATYKANGEKISECRVTAGPYHPSPSSSSSSSSEDSSSTRNDDWGDDWRNPMNPLSPFNPFNM